MHAIAYATFMVNLLQELKINMIHSNKKRKLGRIINIAGVSWWSTNVTVHQVDRQLIKIKSPASLVFIGLPVHCICACGRYVLQRSRPICVAEITADICCRDHGRHVLQRSRPICVAEITADMCCRDHGRYVLQRSRPICVAEITADMCCRDHGRHVLQRSRPICVAEITSALVC